MELSFSQGLIHEFQFEDVFFGELSAMAIRLTGEGRTCQRALCLFKEGEEDVNGRRVVKVRRIESPIASGVVGRVLSKNFIAFYSSRGGQSLPLCQ